MVTAMVKIDFHYTDDPEVAKAHLLGFLNRPTHLTNLVGVIVSGMSVREGDTHYEGLSGNTIYFDLRTIDIMDEKTMAKRNARLRKVEP
jgi:hypothetical protein